MLVLRLTDPSKIFVTSDLHFDRRPEIEIEQISSGWNSKVPDDGIVFILGDLCDNYKKCKHILDEFKGSKFLVKGNHDHFKNGKIFDTGIREYETDIVMLYIPTSKKSYHILLSHKPVKQSTIKKISIPIDIVIHGHNHRQKQLIRKIKNMYYVNVIIDKHNYWVLSINEILQKIWEYEHKKDYD